MLLVIGLALFFSIHLLPSIPGLRDALITRFGEKGFKGAFSLVSVVGLVLAILGYGDFGDGDYDGPPVWATHLAFTVMPIAFILTAAAHMKGHIRKKLRHPMMIGVGLWSAAHFLANPDWDSHLLFGGFFLYALVSILSAELRGKGPDYDKPLVKHDFIAVGGGLAVFVVVLGLHGVLFGVQPGF